MRVDFREGVNVIPPKWEINILEKDLSFDI